jgi:hypothetical protein
MSKRRLGQRPCEMGTSAPCTCTICMLEYHGKPCVTILEESIITLRRLSIRT